ncbi:polysaccharide biosynthesis/export family protein [Aureivirga sp. CE67]|uniref:polysaccharide biosynthesis/export family protein n=1 Tax=Aureivirga sp. CE67 TaxID=1788983 RepID=UPI0018C982C6|nr:polysaccharide biosynthesis/export family protein [Aureivirga sp. CE67]
MKLESLTGKLSLVLIVSILFTSCVSKKKMTYLQGGSNVENTLVNYKIKFTKDDIVSIEVTSLDQESVNAFNGGGVSAGQELKIKETPTYLINSNGNINFPIIGEVKIEGLTNDEATILLEEKISDYVKNPVVNIRLKNFKVTVLGEVKRPGTFALEGERVTILEALGLAGDLLISGKRKNVLVVRELENKKEFIRVDLTNENLVNSKAYYLNQNDVIYIEPNQTKKDSSAFGPSTAVTISLLSTLVSLIAILTR